MEHTIVCAYVRNNIYAASVGIYIRKSLLHILRKCLLNHANVSI